MFIAVQSSLWIEKVFRKRECHTFVASARDAQRCMCGRPHAQHYGRTLLAPPPPAPRSSAPSGEQWQPLHHTEASPTDAFGTLEFQGGPHPTKAQVNERWSFRAGRIPLKHR